MSSWRSLHCLLLIIVALVAINGLGVPLNHPHDQLWQQDKVLHASFSERPKHLDPARAYSANEYTIIAQVYEPLYQYHYLKRPYELEPLTAKTMPSLVYRDQSGHQLKDPKDPENIATTTYLINIRDDVRYGPHPAFVFKNKRNDYLYHQLSDDDIEHIDTLGDFPKTATRKLKASDYVYQIKRLADHDVHSPIASMMGQFIVGFDRFGQQVAKWREKHPKHKVDLRDFTLEGVSAPDEHTLKITIKGKHPQFIYWLAMPFFAPMPWEADHFYNQEVLAERNITLDWFPVGTGAYYLAENNPNRRMVLKKNPAFHSEHYPVNGQSTDQSKGFLKNAGKRLPFLDTVVFSLEKESIPRWNKFLQGYYDRSGIVSDAFDQAITFSTDGDVALTQALVDKQINLSMSVEPSIYYWGFNMMDSVVGGYSDKAKKLRQALSIVFDTREYISIFLNERGIEAQDPVPPGIYGDSGKNNTNLYQTNGDKRTLAEAKALLAEAGYPGGINTKTGKPLTLDLAIAVGGGPGDQARLSWLRSQFEQLGVQLNIRANHYNRFQEKIRNGDFQMYSWGWNADYPDAQNFLMLLYGPNGKVRYGGENASNYHSARFDQLYEQISQMENSPERSEKIAEMIRIVREDAPWIWGFHPKSFVLYHSWVDPVKPNAMANNTLKYINIHPQKRQQLIQQWNQPNYWPILIVLFVVVVFSMPVMLTYWRKERRPPDKISKPEDKGE